MKIGEKVKCLRIQNSLTQEELANRSDLTKGFISQLERDLTSPSIATLVDILDGLGTNLKDFFNESQNEKVVFTSKDVIETENEELRYKLKWLIPNAQKNEMEPIVVEIAVNGKTKEDYPHEGEEFGYVLDGKVSLYIGEKVFDVNKGESFYFKPSECHYIENIDKTKARVLWVSTPPSF